MDNGYTRILWRNDEHRGAEHFTAHPTPDGWRLAGTVVLPIEDEPAHIRYTVDLDHGWRTRRAEVVVDAVPEPRTFTFAVGGRGDHSRWTVEGTTVAGSLDGCVDVDLGFTPATNTLQIRRLGLEVGESRTLPVAWLAYPELTVQPLTQTYTRLGPDRWEYGDEDYTAELLVDPGGYVLRYGDDVWTAVAHRR